MTRFSERQGYEPQEIEISIRAEAPDEFRGVLADIAYECGLTPHQLRSIVCRELRAREDPSNWSAFPNVDGEARGHLDSCEWYQVYDIAEAIYERLEKRPSEAFEDAPADCFTQELNRYFRQRGIGWQLVDGHIEVRGTEGFERALGEARSELAEGGRSTAANEIHQAIADLSRRPSPDVTGAIQHALAALECVARDMTGDPRATLGTILSRNPNLLPPPLDQAVEKLWGFASEQGRHLREGRSPSAEEAELAVIVAAGVCRYLSKKARTSTRI
jgi:hypothetical protein